MNSIRLPHYLFFIFILLAVGDRLLAPLFLQTGALLLLLAAILRCSGLLLTTLENDRPFRLVVFVIAVFVLTLAFSDYVRSPFVFFTSSLQFAVAALFFIMLLFAVRTAPWSGPAVLRWYLIAAAAAAAWALVYFFITPETRVSANWANPSLFGAMLVPALLHAVCRPGRWDLKRLLLTALFSAALLFTYSRGIIVALLLTMPVLWFWEKPASAGVAINPGTRRAGAPLVIVLLLILHLLLGVGRWTTSADPQSFGRLAIWQATGEIIVAHPWRGVGFSALGSHMPPHKFPSQRDPFLWGQIAREAHNEYLHFAAEFGLPALIIALYLLALLLRTVAAARLAPPGLRPALVVWLLHSGVDNLAHFLPALLLPGLLLALILPAAWPAPRPLAYPRPARGLALLGAFLALALVVPPVIGETRFNAGLTAEESNDLAGARTAYADAVACSPLAGLYRMHAGGIFLREAKAALPTDPAGAAGLFAAGAGYFQSAVVLEPDNTIYRAQLARIHLLIGQNNAAEEQLRLALVLDPTDVVHWRRLAALQRQSGDTVAAVAALRQAIALEPLYADGYHDLAQLEPRPFWRRMAVATHGAAQRYLRHLLDTDISGTSIFRYVQHLQELPPDAFKPMAGARPLAASGGDSLALWSNDGE